MADNEVCALCGREVRGLPDACRSGARWFCSPGHRIDFESRKRTSRRGSPVALSAALLAAGLLLGGAALWHVTHSHREQDAPPGVITVPNLARFAYHVDLGPVALWVADRYVRAEFTSHDCDQLIRLGSSTPGLNGQPPRSRSDCRSRFALITGGLRIERLVRHSRTLERGCNAGTDAARANECASYRLVHYTPAGFQGLSESNCSSGSDYVYLQPRHGTWKVIAEQTEADADGTSQPCTKAALGLWRQRVTP